ncbi:MAG: peptide MFS transporter [Alphaproteobacteria bacterium]|nr:peptide MFS transporter [Alphaproteobacteria bacterium]
MSTSDTSFFGHPKGLSTLFFTEMWERFSYYGLRALLILYMTAAVAEGGLGWDVGTAGAIYGTYTALVYLMSVPGGWLADKVFGQRRAVLYGGISIAAGHFSMATPIPAFFVLGLALIIIGTGLLKPNISAIVGQLYASTDERRDAGFSIFYMGINLGAFLGPFITGYLAQDPGWRETLTGWGMNPANAWHWGFGAAGVGMTLGLIQYVLGAKNLGEAGVAASGASTPELARHFRRRAVQYAGAAVAVLVVFALLAALGAITVTATLIRDVVGASLLVITVVFFGMLFLDKSWTTEERGRLWVIFLFFLAAALFWSVFDQAGSTMNLFADRNTENTLFGWAFPSSWYQSLNPLYIILFAPVFAAVWQGLGARQPSAPVKLAVALIGAAVSFWVLAAAAMISGEEGRVSPLWLVGIYLIQTWAELCLSPVGLSSMSKLAPAKIVGAMMGVWFLGTSVGNFFAGQMATFYDSLPLAQLFGAVSVMPLVLGILMLVFAQRIVAKMGGVR